MKHAEKARLILQRRRLVYTTGAFLIPRRVKIKFEDDEIPQNPACADQWQWRWLVSDFGVDGGEYLDGKDVLLDESADSMEKLLRLG